MTTKEVERGKVCLSSVRSSRPSLSKRIYRWLRKIGLEKLAVYVNEQLSR